jgi:hypothetical protein
VTCYTDLPGVTDDIERLIRAVARAHLLTVDTVAERIDQRADHRRQWARRTKTRYRDRPREQWITIPVPSIIDTDTFQHSRHAPSETASGAPTRQPEGVRVRVSYVNVE